MAGFWVHASWAYYMMILYGTNTINYVQSGFALALRWLCEGVTVKVMPYCPTTDII
jgi:hypothetical protein